MFGLSAEQQRKIEENKAAALLKKQQFIQKEKCASLPLNPTSSLNNTRENFIQNKTVKKELPIKQNVGYTHATFSIVSDDKFIADMNYHEPSIEIFKTIPGRLYDATLKKWTFPLSQHGNLVSKLRNLDPAVVVNAIPDPLLRSLSKNDELDQVDWARIDKYLRESLLPFQVDGIRFGIKKQGRCLIADDMGLGKTIQALGIACYFKENWPLLIICPSSMKFPWQEAVKTFLPNVNPSVTVVNTGRDPMLHTDIIITSYDLMKNCGDKIEKKRFGMIIFDESHLLKSSKSARTKVALQLCKLSSKIILLSGTPALSRPQELYSQISAIDSYTFPNFYDFGMRYCDGKKDKFGWNFNGSSNLEELEVYLRKKIMIRRLKSEVLAQLPEKIRKVVVLKPNMVKTVMKQLQQIESEYTKQKGADKHSTLLSYYSMTGSAKLAAVCEYIDDKVENNNKFLVFAHHANVLNGICDLLEKKNVEYIRIDGSVNSEDRQLMCQRFQTADKCRVAVLSLKAANSGITLTEAQLVIFAELYWNPGELTQAEDRAHRIGQQDSVLVEYLLARGTADDHLWNLVQSKLNVLNKVGLSKDNFKNADTKHLQSENQLTLTSMFEGKTEDTSQKKNDSVPKMEDDDIFENINLEEIENEYLGNSKKRKIDLDCIF
ncbi:hypothetical protein RUM44_010426 [Polyplax serrata]|uniref:SWI/SNF-related matrix-associated actin-dependent regulator of chromatin subfamily A-like protein 1 n=1 Tax=Polyplax serrata TaxID=468196 RepID=A0ABR1AVF9_POLSC